MNAIVAVDRNWAIGNQGQLLVSIPNDHKMFRKETLNKVILYGRKTLETFPMSQPLDRRRNIILSRNPEFSVKNAEIARSVEEALSMVKDVPEEDVYVIGGATIYKEFLPYVDTVHVTRVDYSYAADAWFPNLDEDPDWEVTAESTSASESKKQRKPLKI